MTGPPDEPTPATPDEGDRGWRGTSMALIADIMERPLDPLYEDEARRRREAGRPGSTGYRTPLLLVAAILVGFLLAVAAVSLRAPQTAAQETRQELIAKIEAEEATGDDLGDRISGLRSEVEQLQGEALEGRDAALAQELQQLATGVGAVALEGPGLTITLDDAPAPSAQRDGSGDPRVDPVDDAGRVTSRDMVVVVNGLWAAGAEAIAINGQRLTVHSAIRFAGQAILVDFRGLARPYVITAIGQPGEMREAFAKGPGGRYLDTLRDSFGIVGEVVENESVTVPAASRLSTRLATPMPVPEHSPGPDPQLTPGAAPEEDAP